LLGYLDVLGVTDNRKVLPNIGAETLTNINSWITATATLTGAEITVALAKKVVPGSLTLTFTDDSTGNTYTMTDDRQGNLVGVAGYLASGTVTYTTGSVVFQIGAVFTPGVGDTYSIKAIEDVSGTPEFGGTPNGHNRFKTDLQYFQLNTLPDMLIGESNLVSMAAMQKSTGIDPMTFLGTKLTELFTKVINRNLISALVNGYTGNTYEIDMATMAPSYNDYRSSLDFFASELINVDTALATKSVKGVKATCYVVGTEVGNFFRKTKLIGTFVENKATNYINDLIGTYDGIPVLQHVDLATTEGYAIHKTLGGELAPVARGIFLPLTNTPTVANYNQPTQVATGVFYQEQQKSIVPELCMKFTVTTP